MDDLHNRPVSTSEQVRGSELPRDEVQREVKRRKLLDDYHLAARKYRMERQDHSTFVLPGRREVALHELPAEQRELSMGSSGSDQKEWKEWQDLDTVEILSEAESK